MLTNHCRSLHAATPIRFSRSSCKRHYACSQSKKQPWRSHSNAICGDWVAKHNRTTRNRTAEVDSGTDSGFGISYRGLPRRIYNEGTITTVANHNGIPIRECGKIIAVRGSHSRRIRPHRPSAPERYHLKNAFRAAAILQIYACGRLPPNLQCERYVAIASSRFGDRLCMEKHRVSCICYLSKTHFVSSKFTMRERILQLQITMEYRFENDPRRIRGGSAVRGGSEEDPTTPETVSHPSIREWSEEDPTDFVWKNIGFRASAISQKRISCETSSKFTMRERSYSCKSQWNTDSRMIREWSEEDPRRIRGGSDHTRDRLAPVAPQR